MKAADVVKVRVKDVDVARKRIALTIRSGAIDTPASGGRATSVPPLSRNSASPPRQAAPLDRGCACG